MPFAATWMDLEILILRTTNLEEFITVVGLQGHMVALFLVFKGISILVSIVAIPIYIPTE